MIDKTLLDNLVNCLDTIVPEEQHLGLEEIRGLFYAMMITPNKNQPMVWMSALFYGERPPLTDDQINGLDIAASSVREAYQQSLLNNQLQFPYDFERMDETVAEQAYRWCEGFYIGLLIDEGFWYGKPGEPVRSNNQDLQAARSSAKLFRTIITQDFTGFGAAQTQELKAFILSQGQEPTEELMTACLFPNVPVAAETLKMYGIKALLDAQPKVSKPAIKIGRNDPCHCGSGKKYKKCCGSVV